MAISRHRLYRLVLFGILAGVTASCTVLLFRWGIEHSQELFLPDHRIGNYEALSPWIRLALCVSGGFLLGLVMDLFPRPTHEVGIAHLLGYMTTNRTSRLPVANLAMQFLSGMFAIATGQSVDREGPGVHIGGASSSTIGRLFHASENEHYVLTACGGAAAIAAAFNTPLAGVVFVIEVLRMRYGVDRFMPVVLAAVIGAVGSRIVYGPHPAFIVPPLDMASLWELPLVAILGISTGLLSTLFIGLTGWFARRAAAWNATTAFTLAGTITGLLALAAPEIMGISYDTLDKMMQGRIVAGSLVLVLSAKLLATSISIGLRVPGGLIGPTFVLGGALGGIGYFLAMAWYPANAGSPGFYSMIGMVAMMGATLRAPLAALTASLELTANPNIILPGMIAVISADFISSVVFGRQTVFDALRSAMPSDEAGA